MPADLQFITTVNGDPVEFSNGTVWFHDATNTIWQDAWGQAPDGTVYLLRHEVYAKDLRIALEKWELANAGA